MQNVLYGGLGAPGPWEQELGARGSCLNELNEEIGFAGHVPYQHPRTSRF